MLRGTRLFPGLRGRIRVSLGLALSAAVIGGGADAAMVDGDSATVQWSASSGPVAGYMVWVSRDGGALVRESFVEPSPTEVTVAGDPGETVQVGIMAYDADGNTSELSQLSEAIMFAADDPGDPGAGGGDGIYSVPAGAGFSEPVYATAPAGDPRLFVAERAGRVVVLENGETRGTPFLDIRGRVGTAGDGGLLGLAFDPDFAMNGIFYVLYTDLAGDTVLSRFELGQDANVASAGSEEVLLTVEQPFEERNGGTIAFSPVDGYLYVALGDGGGADDPAERAQDGQELLGKMLRLDVSAGPGEPYAIPADNPFVGDPGVLDEIWALGLRDPYRWGFDSMTGDLWLTDVGQVLEEINFEMAGDGGHNYGWDVMEGSDCNPNDPAPAPPCDDASLTGPVVEYDHQQGDCGVIGGTVYNGPGSALAGQYLFGDLCTGSVWSVDPQTFEVTDQTLQLGAGAGTPMTLAAIAEGGAGEMYTVHTSGSLFRVGPAATECDDGIDNDGDGRVDAGADPGCDDASDTSERSASLVCDDGFDNDRDGQIDYPADPDCSSPIDEIEQTLFFATSGPTSGSNGSSCGVGIELVPLLPLLMALRHRRRPRS